MIPDEIADILKQVQMCNSCHQLYLKRIEKIFNKMSQNEFLRIIFGYLRGTVFHLQNEYSERIIDFFAKFVIQITSKRESENPDDPDVSLLRTTVDLTLKTLSSARESFRYNSCLLLRLILHNVGEESSFDDDLYDKIQEALLTRAYDRTHSVQLQALLALERLQNPANHNCPIIKMYCLLASTDKNSAIRTESIRMIAPVSPVLSLLINRTRDINSNVQKAAFKRCTDILPKRFSIEERQFILKSGLSCDANAKKVFNNLLITWFNFYERNFIKLLNALKLDAIEDDFIKWENLCDGVFKNLLKQVPIEDIINALPLQDKLIPLDKMSDRVETILFWLLTIKFLKVSNLLDEWDVVLPDLAPFCDYIASISQLKNQYIREGKWETLEYSQILYQLLEIIELCDTSEEAGRQKLHAFVLSQIKEEAGDMRILRKLIRILSQLIPQKEDFINVAKGIISELHEVYVGSDVASSLVTPTPIPTDNVEAKIIQTQIWTAQMQLDEALKSGDYLKAEEFKKKRNDAQERLNQFAVVEAVEAVVIPEAERNAIACNILNVFIAFMESPIIDSVTATLQSIFDLVIKPLSDNYSDDVRWRYLRALGSICIIDEAMAKKSAEILMVPLSTYYNGSPNKQALIGAIEVVSDLFLCYNTQVFSVESSEVISRNISKRKLYSNNDGDLEVTGITKFYFEGVIHVIMDLIDDEDTAISRTALISIHRMIMDKLSISPQFFSRLLLKWYNPTTDLSLRQLLSFIITSYLNHVESGKEVMINSFFSVLRQITSAGMESPLADIDVEDVLKFVAVFTKSDDQIKNHQLSLSQMVLAEIRKQTGSGFYTQHLTKLLVYLKFPKEDASVIKEVLNQVDSLLEDMILTKSEVVNLNKFKKALMEDVVMNSVVDGSDAVDHLGTNEIPDCSDQIARKNEHQVLTSNVDHGKKGSNEICQPGQNTTSAESINDNQNKENHPSLQTVSASETIQENMDKNHRLDVNQNSCPAEGGNQSHQLTQDQNVVGKIQNKPNRHLMVVIKKGVESAHHSTSDRNSTESNHHSTSDRKSAGSKLKVIACKMAKNSSRNIRKRTRRIQKTSSSEITIESDSDYQNKKAVRRSTPNHIVSHGKKVSETDMSSDGDVSESDSDSQHKRLTRNSLINTSLPGLSKKNGPTTRTSSSNVVNDHVSGNQNEMTTQSIQDTQSPVKGRRRQFSRAIRILSNEIVNVGEQAYRNKIATHQSTQNSKNNKSSKNDTHKKTSQSQTPSSNEIINGSDSNDRNQMLTRRSSQSSSSDKDRKNHGRKNGQTTQKSSNEVVSGVESSSQNKMSTRQSSQSSSSVNNSFTSRIKNHKKNIGQTTQTSSSSNVGVSDSDSQNKKMISQPTENSLGSVRRTRSQIRTEEKNNGQTNQTSLSTNDSVSDLGSQYKKLTSQSTPNSSGSSKSTRSETESHRKNGHAIRTSLITNVSVLENQGKMTASQSTENSSGSVRCTRSQIRTEKKNNGQTTQTSLRTNDSVSDLGNQYKKLTSQSTPNSSRSSKSTRSETESHRKNGHTTRTSLITNVSVLENQGKKTASQSTENSSGSVRRTRSQIRTEENNEAQITQTSLSTNDSVSDLGSQHKKLTSQSTPNSSRSSKSTRSETESHRRNVYTTRTSLTTNVSVLENQNKKMASQSSENSSGSDRSTRSQKGNYEKNNGQSRLSLSTSARMPVSDSQNKKMTSQTTDSSSGSGRNTRSQIRIEKDDNQTTQTSLSTNDSPNKKASSQSTDISSESGRNTRSQAGHRKRSHHLSQITSSLESESETPIKNKMRRTNHIVSTSTSSESEFPHESSLDSSIENRPSYEKTKPKQSSFSSVENQDQNAKKVRRPSQISSPGIIVKNKVGHSINKKLRELNHSSTSSGNSEIRKSSRLRLRIEARSARRTKRKSNEALKETNSSSLSSSPCRKKRKVAHSSLKRRLR